MTRWVLFIQLFSFDLVHKAGKTFTMPDGVFRRPVNEGSDDEAEEFDEELKFINAKGGIRTLCRNLEVLCKCQGCKGLHNVGETIESYDV